MKRWEFLPSSGFLSRRDVTVESDIKTHSFLFQSIDFVMSCMNYSLKKKDFKTEYLLNLSVGVSSVLYYNRVKRSKS